MTKENVCYCGEYGGGVHTKSARCADPPPSKELAYRDALARIRQVCRSDAKDFEAATIERRQVYDIANMTLDANGDLYASGHEPPAVQGPCPNCGAKWVSAELSTSQEPQSELPKPINHDLWRHLHDEHGLTLVQSELDEILRLSQPPGLRQGLERAIEIIEGIEPPSDYYEPYKTRLVDALCDAVYSASTKEVK
jgi:hypothetical protein